MPSSLQLSAGAADEPAIVRIVRVRVQDVADIALPCITVAALQWNETEAALRRATKKARKKHAEKPPLPPLNEY